MPPSASTTVSNGETRYVQLSPSWITVKTALGVETPRGKIRISPVRLFVLPLVGLVFGRTLYVTVFERSDDPFLISIQLSSDLATQAQPGGAITPKLPDAPKGIPASRT